MRKWLFIIGFWSALFMSYKFYGSILYAILCGIGGWIYILYNVFMYWHEVRNIFS